MPKGRFKAPKSGTLPKRGKEILKTVYSSCRYAHPEEKHSTKAMCARIAWSAVRKSGYKKKSYARKR